MSRPHVDRAQARIISALLVDTCTILRRSLGDLDPITLAYGNDATTIWSGPCFVNARPDESGEFVTIEALGRLEQRVKVRLPIACPDLIHGDEITVTGSDNPTLIGETFDVIDDTGGTFVVTKIVRTRRRERIDR
jgi:hypothetical protein